MTTAADAVKWMEGHVTAARGFLATGIHCGIKKKKPDLALILSDVPASAAGMFTTNKVKAAPVRYCEKVIGGGAARAIVVNAGNANACTGDQGLRDAEEMAAITARELGVSPAEVLVASTGVIGMLLPMDKLRAGIPAAAKALWESGEGAELAIMTTDAFPKTAAAQVDIDGVTVTIGGMCKGAGMIHPNMATMLCFLTTDANVPPSALREALGRAVAVSFNSITVDGDTSTNDTVLLLANGRAGGPPIESGAPFEAFVDALTHVSQELAKKVVRDGEGASKLVEITVEGAKSDAEAKRGALSIAHSPLVKTMMYGAEPNWGRILMALGKAGIDMAEERTEVYFGSIRMFQNGLPTKFDWDEAVAVMKRPDVKVRARLGVGEGSWTVWTCDLNEEYVRINGSYIT
jgi:glutamate N-acetyltransferase/amino-acid N-acetyltransferase